MKMNMRWKVNRNSVSNIYILTEGFEDYNDDFENFEEAEEIKPPSKKQNLVPDVTIKEKKSSKATPKIEVSSEKPIVESKR